MKQWLKGKKTYLVMFATFVIGGMQASGIEIPPWVYGVLAAAGLGAVGAKIERKA